MSDNYEVELAVLQKEVVDLRADVRELSAEVAGLVDAWKTASGVVAFIKWLSGLVLAIGVIWTALKVKLGG